MHVPFHTGPAGPNPECKTELLLSPQERKYMTIHINTFMNTNHAANAIYSSTTHGS